MKILFISHENDLNGASRSMIALIDELIKRNHKIYVLSSYTEGDFIKALKERNVKIINARYYRWMIIKSENKYNWYKQKILYCLFSLRNKCSAIKLSKYLSREKIDIIHSNTSVVSMGALLSKYSKIPHVMHIREFGEEDFNMHFLGSKRYALRFLDKYSKKIIVISQSLFQKYINYFSDKKLEVVYNGIDSSYLLKKDKKYDVQNLQILIAGRVGKEKGQFEAVKALRALNDRGYTNIKLKIAGNGEIDEINKLIKDLDLVNQVECLGYCSEINNIRKNIDIELVCSKKEAFGRVTIEAMMSMTPVIGSNTGGTKELIIDEFNGYLYEQGNYIDLANKIEKFLNHPENMRKFGENAYYYAKENFNSELNANNVLKIYEEIIKEKI